MYCSFKNRNQKTNTINFLEDNFTSLYTPHNPNNLVDLVNYKYYKLKNLNIFLHSDRISIRGSIPKYYVGDNAVGLKDEQIIDAFKLIQFQLPTVDWETSIVTRLDYGVTFDVSLNPSEYINQIRASKNNKNLMFTTKVGTCVLGNKSHAIVVYDKGYESELEETENLIRLEYRMYKAALISKKFDCNKLTLSSLLSELNKLPELWYKQYCLLEKDYSPVFEGISSKFNFHHAMISKYGYENCKMLIVNSSKKNLISKTQKYNLIRYIRELKAKGKTLSDENSPINELDKLVENYITDYRNTNLKNINTISKINIC